MMPELRRLLLNTAAACGLLALLTSAAPLAAEDQVDLEKERTAVRVADHALAAAATARNREAVERLIDPDGIYLSDRADRGREEWIAKWDRIFRPESRVSLDLKPLLAEVAASGELAYSIGACRFVLTSPKGDEQRVLGEPAHYLTVWRKNAEGQWKLLISGTLVVSRNPDYGVSPDPRRGITRIWPKLNTLDARLRLEWKPEMVVEAKSGEMGFTFGAYEVFSRQRDKTLAGTGAYLTVWEKDDQDFWSVLGESFTPPYPIGLENQGGGTRLEPEDPQPQQQ